MEKLSVRRWMRTGMGSTFVSKAVDENGGWDRYLSVRRWMRTGDGIDICQEGGG